VRTETEGEKDWDQKLRRVKEDLEAEYEAKLKEKDAQIERMQS
jgi:hypothetical protein